MRSSGSTIGWDQKGKIVSALRIGALALASFIALPACKGGNEAPSTAASGSPSSTVPASTSVPASSSSASVAERPTPVDPADVAKVVNPKNEAPYAGPTGTLRGTIRIDGDPSPDSNLKIAPNCGEGAATYGKLFRVGQDKALADALVAVTGYSGFVPAKGDAAKITIHGCAFARRTLAATFGQRIEVANLDPQTAYMPYLDGAPRRAVMVAIPQGDPVRLYPQKPGRFMLRDELPKQFMVADVFVLAYPTTAVTGLDGEYEITGIPVGKVTVNAYLPVLSKSVNKSIEIKEGDNTADLTLNYVKDEDLKPRTAPSGSAHPKAPPH
jgi:hypothetical protein